MTLHSGGLSYFHRRSTQAADEGVLTRVFVVLAVKCSRYGYRRITAMLNEAGLSVGKGRVQRIWRREGLESAEKTEAQGEPVAQ